MTRGERSRGRQSGPRLLGAALGEVRERLAPPDLLGEVQARWRAVAGEQVAEEAWPDLERAGTVTVRCRSAVWAAELTMLARDLLERLNAELPRERQVRALKFTAAPSRGSRRGS
jgi:predicted nucleic acid-binding Zn ribbon protein